MDIVAAPTTRTASAPIGRAGHPADAFLPFLDPVIRQARAHIGSVIHELVVPGSGGGRIDPERVSASLVDDLSDRLLSVAAQTLERELRASAGSHLLRGRDPEARFASFMEQLCEPSCSARLFDEHPVLRVLLSETLHRWTRASSECLARWCRDAQDLAQSLLAGPDPVLIGIEAGAGDRHRGGRSVSILHFDDASSLVYKPRSVAVDVHFYELLDFLNGCAGTLALQTLRVVDRLEYGWAEFAPGAPCTSLEQVGRFYERQGSLLAVLYLLGATDMHAGNLIASGEHPVLVDLETLFHPLGARGSIFHDDDEPTRYALLRSVMRVGLVPAKFWGTEDARGIDFSGLGGQAGQLTPRPVPVWIDEGTDQMRIENRRIAFDPRNNFPTMESRAVDPSNFRDRVLAGFEQTYRLLIAARHSVLQTFFPKFSTDHIRILLRQTDIYQRLVYDGLRPEMLRQTGAREAHFRRLPEIRESGESAAEIAAAERGDLLNNDIPYFWTRADSCSLLTTAGRAIRGYFPLSGLAEARARYLQFSEEDLERQKNIIRAAFICMRRDAEESAFGASQKGLVGSVGGGG